MTPMTPRPSFPTLVGILGGGQLARMLALAGLPLGLRFRFLDPSPDACAAAAGILIQASYADADGLTRLADGTDVITYEFENVDAASVHALAQSGHAYPSAKALETAQERLAEKTTFQRLDIPVPPFCPADSAADIYTAAQTVGFPCVVKTRRFGYDGKGQMVLRDADDIAAAQDEFGDTPVIVEAFVDFTREVSIIATRDRQGAIVFYPLSENTHAGGILRLAVARPQDPMQDQAEALATQLLEDLDYVGTLALELFDTPGGLLANEFAPRVHNSGHWTIEGAETSQFENHLRAICGLPLGPTAPVGFAAMINVIGTWPDTAPVLALPGAHLHDYGKAERPGRKIGHVTLRADTADGLDALLTEARKHLPLDD